jgi:hypothetical protein
MDGSQTIACATSPARDKPATSEQDIERTEYGVYHIGRYDRGVLSPFLQVECCLLGKYNYSFHRILDGLILFLFVFLRKESLDGISVCRTRLDVKAHEYYVSHGWGTVVGHQLFPFAERTMSFTTADVISTKASIHLSLLRDTVGNALRN